MRTINAAEMEEVSGGSLGLAALGVIGTAITLYKNVSYIYSSVTDFISGFGLGYNKKS
ncbi:hypothetical protein LPH50_09245 [Xylella taiwanensis]|uniref:Bacteriocin n=1 Tax=Xylella taiwanensis TaxID=1444770 RepID=A0ABS8TV56_9GAMM|nr:hypothetical protein [Xylella taiwanensis]MCD8456128.1 hypothetical protein [Xylella taiwanensis]MCD8458533.1 hypothetical protein [Xylella taiwanensis]MCD8460668.1 hypothetical protein [Xylella taiwanensis]MCD8463270.1 hypothetical protein [Xylella taiwanensis]MCD8465173.1 hypothetical protein [Xylella taiwanensis]